LRVDGSWMFADNTGSLDGRGLGIDLRITADVVIKNDSAITTASLRAERARDLQLTAGSIHVDNSFIPSSAPASEDGGNVMGIMRTLTLTGGGHINSNTTGRGHGGDLTVTATDAITSAGQSSGGALVGWSLPRVVRGTRADYSSRHPC
jgi:hypothetical protein